MSNEIILPEMGEGVEEAIIARWLIQEGDSVSQYDPIVEVETDKVTTEIVAEQSGVLHKILVAEGETVTVGTVLALIGAEDGVAEPAPLSNGNGATTTSSGNGSSMPVPVPVMPASPDVFAGHSYSRDTAVGRVSPVVARMVAEHQVDLTQIIGTGLNGRITKRDVSAYLNTQQPQPVSAPAVTAPPAPVAQAPAVPTSPAVAPTPVASAPQDHVHQAPASLGRPGELVQLSRMRQLIANHMVESKLHTSPHVTTIFEVDLSKVMAHRTANKEDFAARGINLTLTAYFMMATAMALAEHPMVNSRWTDEGIYLNPEVNIGMAVAIDEGLIVPVLKHADELSLAGIARQVNDLAIRARNNQLKPDEIAGGTFTITNHGVSGSLFATPIINQPQTGILGVGAIQKRVVVLDDDTIGIRPMVYIGLTFDHRVLDGAGADFFVASIKRSLESWS